MKLLGVPLHPVWPDEIEATIAGWLAGGKRRHVVTINPEMLVAAQRNQAFAELLHTTTNVPDGVGITLVQRVLYRTKCPRIAGVTVAKTVAQVCAQQGLRLGLVGGRGVAQPAAEALVEQFPTLKVTLADDGDPTKTPDNIGQVDVLLVAFGAPKQEVYINQTMRNHPHLRLGVGVGGTFDFWAGKATRAPLLWQRLGVEWLWRLGREPSRIRRIVTAVVRFPLLCAVDKYTKKT